MGKIKRKEFDTSKEEWERIGIYVTQKQQRLREWEEKIEKDC